MDKILTVKDKIFAFLNEKGISKAEFYAKTGIQPSNFKGKNKDSLPGSAMLVKILTQYPELSADWLLTGDGDMLKTKCNPEVTPAHQQTYPDNKDTNNNTIKQEKQDEKTPLVTQLLDTIKEQAEEIGRLKARIDELERRRGDNAGDAPTSDIAHVG